MELRHLEGFVALAEVLSFTKAATNINVSQSAMTRLIRQLETDLGVVLVERSTHRVALSDAGVAFLPQAKSVMAQVAIATRVARGEPALGLLPPVRTVRRTERLSPAAPVGASGHRRLNACSRWQGSQRRSD